MRLGCGPEIVLTTLHVGVALQMLVPLSNRQLAGLAFDPLLVVARMVGDYKKVVLLLQRMGPVSEAVVVTLEEAVQLRSVVAGLVCAMERFAQASFSSAPRADRH